jgi:spore coat polysaccharide biosynthesis predicted glycosyltransferase SpsG
LVDHYDAASEYFARLKGQGFRVAVIDDLADRDLTATDWVLNQNLGASGLHYRARSDCVKLLGPTYALLRPEFALARGTCTREFSTEDRHVLLTLGGGDTTELSSQILDALNLVSRPLEVLCVWNGDGSLPTRLAEVAVTSRHTIRFLQNVTNMAEWMVWADLSVNAGGSTCWELCCLGVPMIVLITSRNQSLVASALEQQGCANSLGEWQTASGPELASLVEEFLGNPERRTVMSSRAQLLVDGLGAGRAAESLIVLEGQMGA